MSCSLLAALKPPRNRAITSGFTFQHKLCHDLESLIWVLVYSMMVHQRNTLAATDPEMFELYKGELDECWAAHAHSNLLRSHNHIMMTGLSGHSKHIVGSWFHDPPEAAFFRDAMRLVRNQQDEDDPIPITYDSLCAVFKKHIQLAKGPQASSVLSE